MCVMLTLKMFRKKAAEEVRQTSVLEDRENPKVIDTGICSGKVSQKNT